MQLKRKLFKIRASQKFVYLKRKISKNVLLKFFWTQFKIVHCRGPCSLRPCISRPYCMKNILISFCSMEKKFEIMKGRISRISKSCKYFQPCPAKRRRILKIFNLFQLKGEEFWNHENIFNLVLQNVEEFWRYEKYPNLFPNNREKIWNHENIFNLVPLNEEEFWNHENIFNLVPLNGEEFQNYENISIFSR